MAVRAVPDLGRRGARLEGAAWKLSPGARLRSPVMGGRGSWAGRTADKQERGSRGRKKFHSSVVGRAEGRPWGARGGPPGQGTDHRSDRSRGRLIHRGSRLHSRKIALVSVQRMDWKGTGEGDRRPASRLTSGDGVNRGRSLEKSRGLQTSGRGGEGAGVGRGVQLSQRRADHRAGFACRPAGGLAISVAEQDRPGCVETGSLSL